eukprot:SAG22_NODE_560_length_9102_cov_54.310785_1_plen_31_part_00
MLGTRKLWTVRMEDEEDDWTESQEVDGPPS